ncbi:TPA: hypothetical protein ACMDNN_002768, partial [Vibrio cholerae]
IPENAKLNYYGDDWECNKGYFKRGSGCSKVNVPKNGKLNYYGNDWECNKGYLKSGLECKEIFIPKNATLNYFGNGWQCNYGYIERENSCVYISEATDSEVKRMIISSSISSYPGNCPCPYFTDKAGRRCGGRSAYSRAGGYGPICYDSDISESDVMSFRQKFK